MESWMEGKMEMYRQTKGRKNRRRRWCTPSYWSKRGPTSESDFILFENIWRRESTETQSAKWKHESEDNCIWEAVLHYKRVLRSLYSSLLHHHSTFLFQGGVSEWVIGREGGWRRWKKRDRRKRETVGREWVSRISFLGRTIIFCYKVIHDIIHGIEGVTSCTFSWSRNVLICMRWLRVDTTARWWLFLTYSMKAEEVLRGFNKWREREKSADRSDAWDLLTRNKFEEWFKELPTTRKK